MGYIYNSKKNHLKVGNFICYKGLNYKIIQQLNNTTFKLICIDVIADYLAIGKTIKQCPYIKKDYRELGGCEVW